MSHSSSGNTNLMTFYVWAMKLTSKQLAAGQPVGMSGQEVLAEIVMKLSMSSPSFKYDISAEAITEQDFTTH
jgi:hypothetical protein